ncbi:MAG: hypothetical protein Q9190_005901 [Brigantiaea leucoxantha]
MLARIWSASEAVGIWEQLYEERKAELSKWSEDGSIPMLQFNTSRIELSRENLAEWDASARAWLRAADTVKKVNQHQLRLIIDNLTMPVNKETMDVYASVIEAWKMALTTMDKLVGGINHSVQNGAVLLGLSAWHIYPDMIVLGRGTTTVKQNDPLVAPGGVITIGLRGVELEECRGVYWSLSLANVRYYETVNSEGSISSDASRITFEDIWLVVLGSLIPLWERQGSNPREVAEMICLMWQSCSDGLAAARQSTVRMAAREDSWLKFLAAAAKRYLHSTSHEQEFSKRLVGLGQRRSNLLGHYDRPIPIFELTDATFVQILKAEAKIEHLRHIARNQYLETTDPRFGKDLDVPGVADVMVIKVCQPPPDDRQRKTLFQLATATIRNTAEPKSQEIGSSKHRPKRWTIRKSADQNSIPKSSPSSTYPDGHLLEVRENEEFYELDEGSIISTADNFQFRWIDAPKTYLEDSNTLTSPSNLSSAGSSKIRARKWFTAIPKHEQSQSSAPSKTSVATFQFVYGDINSAALYRRVNVEGVSFRRLFKEKLDIKSDVSRRQITDAFKNGKVDEDRFLHHLSSLNMWTDPHSTGDRNGTMFQALRAIATAAKVYSRMPSATVALSIIERGPVWKARWFKDRVSVNKTTEKDSDSDQHALLPENLSRPAAFACISMFESGSFDFKPADLDKVMAVSAADSMFVAAPILCDPATATDAHEVRRIVGNIGRAGMSFLIPPRNTKTRKIALEEYRVINHDPYNGKVEDCFQDTTLHLGFTGWERELETGNDGGKHKDAFFLESLISAHDRGEWFADLDVLTTFTSPLLCIPDRNSDCGHSTSDRQHPPESNLVAIDRWEEMLERPANTAVVRAHNNWLARLAAAAVSVKLGNHTVLLSGIHCWKCDQHATGRDARGLRDFREKSPIYIL